MDIYSEHLIKIRKNSKMTAVFIFMWAVMLGISVASFLIFRNKIFFSAVISAVAIIGAWRMSRLLNVEYEYIVTNGEVDVDVITGKTDRKRIITFNCKDIDRIEPYTPGCAMYEKGNYDKKNVYCNVGDSDIYCLSFKHRNIGKVCLVMQLPKKMQDGMLPFMDKLVAKEAFK